jgi:phosphate transport system substrate-binding protein
MLCATIVFVCLIAAACQAGNSGAVESTEFIVIGDTALGGLPQAVLNAYESHGNTHDIDYQELDRTQLLGAIQSGTADAAFILYPPDDRSIFSTAVGYQPLAIVTSTDIAVSNLTEGDIRAIFSGRKANWADVGGSDLPIGPVLPFKSVSERAAFEALIMRSERISLSSLMAGGPSQLVILVRAAPGRIGLISGNVIPEGLKALAIDGESVPTNAVTRSSYPLVATVAFIAPAEPGGEAKALLDWILSEDGQKIVADYALQVN